MPRFYKRPPGTKPLREYNTDDLEKAVNAVRCGKLPLRAVAEKYNIDKMKIFRKIKNIHQKQHGGQSTASEFHGGVCFEK
ncbi:unnamed protein product [Diabrotica balteata]|uniref:HTH psq-type domain-containing protein n=1 Tax=Diabrotica balteata TaxID=107213 RepID=A0A9N9XBQ1_DIABA|nr:unnamed protein product [Diabrotica balteata]